MTDRSPSRAHPEDESAVVAEAKARIAEVERRLEVLAERIAAHVGHCPGADDDDREYFASASGS